MSTYKNDFARKQLAHDLIYIVRIALDLSVKIIRIALISENK